LLDKQRAELAAKTLAAAAGTTDKVKAEVAGARAPIVDPSDAKNRARNARLDVVFVTPGN
jgi:outer membrane protein OmpA-like peptidoglycan-associated protein